MAVVLYHLWPKAIPGGYAGVDIFFVISGFLITAHLVREVERSGRVRLAQFWARRARRLLPASLLIIVVSAIATYLWVPESYWQQYFREFWSAAAYFLNWTLATDSVDYLAAENTPSPVQHYWSLSAEEQFYIVWPLLVVLAIFIASRARRVSRTAALAIVLGTVTVASLAYSIFLTATDPSPAYFITPTRAWEFGLGGLLALYLGADTSAGVSDSRVIRPLVSWIGIAALVATCFLYSASTPFPGWAALLPALGTAAVIWAGTPTTWWSPTGLMVLRPVQWLGDVSYSLYLWHWPIIILVPFAIDLNGVGNLDKIAMLAASLVLAWVTKVLVEDPVRKAKFLVNRPAGLTLAFTAATMAIVVGVSVVTWQTLEDGFNRAVQEAQEKSGEDCFGAAAYAPGVEEPCINPELTGTLVPDEAAGESDSVIPKGKFCRTSSQSERVLKCEFAPGTSSRLKIALVGDSHAEHWVPALTVVAEARGWKLDTYLKGGCPFSSVMRTDDIRKAKESCGPWNNTVFKMLKKAKYDVIITSQASGNTFQTTGSESSLEAAARGLVDKWTQVEEELGATVIAIRDNPKMPFNVPSCLSALDDPPAQVDECVAPQSKALLPDPQIEAGKQAGVKVVDLTEFFCRDDECRAAIGSVIVYRDNSHLGGTYSRTLAPFLGKEIDKILKD